MNKLFIAAALLLLSLLAACKGQGEAPGEPATDTTNTTGTSATTLTATGSLSTAGTVADVAPAEKEFVSKAGMSGLAEVQQGNLALTKASNAAVKQFAQRMVTDHTKGNEELQTIASAKGLALPTELDDEHKDALEHLNALSGAEFDKAYMDHMVQDHQKAVADFTTTSQTALDAEIKALAAKTLPTLQEHLTQATEIRSKLK
jgi:putative membrane protein